MIRHLHIENYALIEHLDMDFHSGFSVITGETGAGKSIILGAINYLLGQRADTKSILPGADKCTIEATFGIEGYQLKSLFEENDTDFDEQFILTTIQNRVVGIDVNLNKIEQLSRQKPITGLTFKNQSPCLVISMTKFT